MFLYGEMIIYQDDNLRVNFPTVNPYEQDAKSVIVLRLSDHKEKKSSRNETRLKET